MQYYFVVVFRSGIFLFSHFSYSMVGKSKTMFIEKQKIIIWWDWHDFIYNLNSIWLATWKHANSVLFQIGIPKWCSLFVCLLYFQCLEASLFWCCVVCLVCGKDKWICTISWGLLTRNNKEKIFIKTKVVDTWDYIEAFHIHCQSFWDCFWKLFSCHDRIRIPL